MTKPDDIGMTELRFEEVYDGDSGEFKHYRVYTHHSFDGDFVEGTGSSIGEAFDDFAEAFERENRECGKEVR